MENNNAEESAIEYNKPLSFEQVWQMFQETNKQFKETDKKFEQTDKKIKELASLFTTQWGKLVESLVEGDLIKLLKARGVKVDSIIQRRKGHRNGKNFEFDLIAINETEMVIVEVKTTLRPQDVTEFHEKLWKAKVFMPEYKNMTVYGAVAFITAEGKSDTMSETQGFFVIRATGSSASIINQDDFRPKAF